MAYIGILWVFFATERVAEVSADARRCVPLVAFVVGLVLEEDELVSLVIGTVVGPVGHQ